MFNFDYHDVFTFFFVFIRVASIIFMMPIFSDGNSPLPVKIALSMAMTPIMVGVVDSESWLDIEKHTLLDFFSHIFLELSIGVAIGFMGRIFFAGILMAASIVGFQMGFGTASLFMQDMESQMNGFTALHRSFFLIIFLQMDLHHVYITAMKDSFSIIPSGSTLFDKSIVSVFIETSSGIFDVAMRLSSSILVALLFTMTALGLIARTVPQMNVFTLSFPISFFVGLLVYIASMPFFPSWLSEEWTISSGEIYKILMLMSPVGTS